MSSSNEIRTKPTRHEDYVRMLVLETDEQHPDDHEERGSFGDVFDSLFKRAGDEHDPPLGIETIIRFVAENKGGSVPTLEDVEDVHAILITGSMYDAHGDDPWILKLVDFIQSTSLYSTPWQALQQSCQPRSRASCVADMTFSQLSGESARTSASAVSASATKSSVVPSARRLTQPPTVNGSSHTHPSI